jgi:hypothetical protein
MREHPWNDLSLTVPAREPARDDPCLTMRQTWLAEPEADLQPTYIWLGHSDTHLIVLADMIDADIYSPATQFNDPQRKEGDFLEILLRPDGQTSYYEMHVTPTNCRSQFWFEDGEHVARLRKKYATDSFTQYLQFDRQIFDSDVQIDRAGGRWTMHAAIDLAQLLDSGQPLPARWFAAFCRWDVNRNAGRVISSATSPFTQYNYHQQDQWRTLSLA